MSTGREYDNSTYLGARHISMASQRARNRPRRPEPAMRVLMEPEIVRALGEGDPAGINQAPELRPVQRGDRRLHQDPCRPLRLAEALKRHRLPPETGAERAPRRRFPSIVRGKGFPIVTAVMLF